MLILLLFVCFVPLFSIRRFTALTRTFSRPHRHRPKSLFADASRTLHMCQLQGFGVCFPRPLAYPVVRLDSLCPRLRHALQDRLNIGVSAPFPLELGGWRTAKEGFIEEWVVWLKALSCLHMAPDKCRMQERDAGGHNPPCPSRLPPPVSTCPCLSALIPN